LLIHWVLITRLTLIISLKKQLELIRARIENQWSDRAFDCV